MNHGTTNTRAAAAHDEAVFHHKPKSLAATIRMVIGTALVCGAGLRPAEAELPVPSEVWASMGHATRSITGNTMNIDQTTNRAILNWKSFNVGAENTVNFHQPGDPQLGAP